MTWTDFYLICFVVGFVLSLLAFLGAHVHLPFHFHGTHGLHATHGAGHGNAGGKMSPGRGSGVSPFNFVTFAIFLAWFGGAGFLVTRYSRLWFLAGLVTAVAIGILGAFIIYTFMVKVLMSPEAILDPADFRMEGVLG
jgi:ABC-type transport system involved in cytochrome c biogenesis permease subunit